MMVEKIAAIADKNGFAETLFDSDAIRVYQKESGKWNEVRQLLVNIDAKNGMVKVRESLFHLASELEDCKIIIGKEISGVPFHIFDQAGFSIFEADGLLEDYLDDVMENMNKYDGQVSRIENGKSELNPVPADVEGNYTINLKQIQIIEPALSSKQVLLPFLENTTFYELEIICSHIPPWFDMQLDKMGFGWDVFMVDENEYKVTVYRKKCSC